MAVIQRARNHQVDAAPLWLPRHDDEVVEQASSKPPDLVEGYALIDRLTTTLLGSRWKMATIASTAIAVLLFLVTLPSLLAAGIFSMLTLAFYQSWTLGLLLLVTMRVRSVSVGTAARYWLAGFFTVAMVAFYANGPLAGLVSPSEVWVTPILEELLKAAPLGVAVMMGRRVWRHPGLSDLLIIGFAVGGGYAFHEEALWGRAAASGFEANVGIVVPSVFQPDGLFVVGHAVWTALIGMAIGLFILHRRQPFAVVAAVVIVALVLGDHMAVNDAEGTLGWMRQLSFNGKLPALLFLAAIVAVVLLDQRRLADIGVRDHLFPTDHSHGTRVVESDADDDPLRPFLASRYRRLRNGVHTTIDATTTQWPPRSEAHPAPVAELSRLGRAAGVAVGPGTSESGWARDPESPDGYRFVGPNGFTAYAAGSSLIEPPAPPAAPLIDDPNLDDAERAQLEKEAAAAAKAAARAASIGPTTTSISVPRARLEAQGSPVQERRPDYWQFVGLGVVATALFVFVRLLTAGDASTALIETSLSLPDATSSPAMITGLLGAVAAAVAIRGRNPAELHRGWDVGPGDDPTPHRPDECEA